MQYCFIILLCAMRRFMIKQELTWAFSDIWATRSQLLVRLLSLSLPNSNFFFFFGICVVIVVMDVCDCDVKLLLGRITFELWSRWKFKFCGNLYPAMHIPTDSTLLVSSICFLRDIFFPFPFHYSDSSLITFSISCSCAIQLYCGPTHAFTQYIKLN